MTDLDKLEALAKAATRGLASGEWRSDPYGIVQIWGDSLKGGDTQVAMVRGWGYLTGGGHGALGLTDEDAIAIQSAWANFIAAANPAAILDLIASARRDAEEIERLREAWRLCEEMVKAEDDLIADLVNDERYLDAMKMDFPITNRMRSMLARAAHTGEG